MLNNLKTKVFSLVVIPLIIISILTGVIIIIMSIQNNDKNLETLTKSAYAEKKEFIKNEVLTMATIIEGISKNTTDLKEARKEAIKIASYARFMKGSGYFFAFEKIGENYHLAFHGVKTNLNGVKVSIDKPQDKEMIAKGNDDNAFIEYLNPKPGKSDDELFKKIAFSKFVPGLNWTIVSGLYADDVEDKIKEIKEINNQHLYSLLTTISIIVLILLVIVMFIVSFMSKKLLLIPLLNLEKGLNGFFKYLNKESSDVKMLEVSSNDEIGIMSASINENITKTKLHMEQDKKVLENVKKVVNEVKKGILVNKIEESTDNKGLEDLKNNFNEMITVISNTIADDLNKIKEALEKFRALDFTHRITNTKGETAKELNNLAEIINAMLVDNKKSGLTLNNSASQLLSNISILNNSSNEAAANIEETAAALEEITSNISANTQNVVKMSTYASEVTISVNEGEKLAKETTLSMDEINTQVSSINEAITVIDQISFQTNILSLNAAVEAATAGEAGKGFAVVAQEVRNLAARSAEAARTIKDLVETATSKANHGKQIADKMISGYNGLNDNISKTINLIKDVEMGSKEQQTGIIQINDAINSLDSQTQQNASVASEAKDIADTTSNIANQIVQSANEKEFIGKDSI